MDDASAAELTRLRARAYGPGADLTDDPAASARLMELESQLRSEREAQRPPIREAAVSAGDVGQPWARSAGSSSTAGSPGAAAEPTALPGADDEVQDQGDPANSRLWDLVHVLSSRLPPVATAIVAVSIAAAVALTASTVWALASVPVISQTTASRQVATLEVDPELALPEGFFGTTSEEAIAYEYYGLLLARSSAASLLGEGDECLIGLASEDLSADGQGVSGAVYYGCRAGAFPAAIEVPLDDSAPEQLRAQFPEGGALQFVLQDDRVGVFWDGGATPA